MARAYISAELRRLVRDDARARCGYRHEPEAFLGMPLDIDHLIPEALGGPTVRDNLWLACSRCNDFKGDRLEVTDPAAGQSITLFNPRTQVWTEHFAWLPDGVHLIGRTSIGRATIVALHLNNEFIVTARQFWVEAGRWPPPEDLLPLFSSHSCQEMPPEEYRRARQPPSMPMTTSRRRIRDDDRTTQAGFRASRTVL